jgi:hypothetical protein
MRGASASLLKEAKVLRGQYRQGVSIIVIIIIIIIIIIVVLYFALLLWKLLTFGSLFDISETFLCSMPVLPLC